MTLNRFHRTTDYFVFDAYDEVMFRFESKTGKFFRKFVGETYETEVPRNNKLLYETVLRGQDISSEVYMGREAVN